MPFPTDKDSVSLCLTKHYTMKVHVRVDVEIHVFLTDTNLGPGVAFTPWPLYPRGKSCQYPLARRLVGAHSQ
jgi:hypothetical protein